MSLIATLLSRPSHPSIHTATNRQPAALLAKGQQLMVGFKVNFTRLEGSQWKPETHSFLYLALLLHLYSLPKKLRGQLGKQQGNQRKPRERRKGRALTPQGC